MPSADTIRRLLHDQIERLWSRGELDLVPRNYHPDIVDHMPVPRQRAGLAAMAEVVELFRIAIPDIRLTLHGTIVAGDLGCDWWTLTGTQTGALFGRPPSGRPVRFSGIDMVRVSDDRIAELWHVEDMLRFERQMAGERELDGDPLALLGAVSTDLRVTEKMRIEEGDRRAVRFRVEGTHDAGTLLSVAASGKRFAGTLMEVRGAGDMRVAELAQIRAQIA